MNNPKPRFGILSFDEEISKIITESLESNGVSNYEVFQDIQAWSLKAHSEPYILNAVFRSFDELTVSFDSVDLAQHCAVINLFCPSDVVSKIQDLKPFFEITPFEEIENTALSMLTRLSQKSVLDKYYHQQATKRHHQFYHSSPIGMYRLSLHGELLEVNDTLASIFGFKSTSEFYSSYSEDIHGAFVEAKGHRKLFEQLASGEESVLFETKIERADGAVAWVSVCGNLDVNEVTQKTEINFVVNDITGPKEVEEQVYYDSIHDSLTGLYNRLFIVEMLDEMTHSPDFRDKPFGVAMLDLDFFQKVNDIFGHKEGDKLLLQVTRRFSQVYGEDKVISRLGGDEFLILFTETRTEQELLLEGDRLLVLFEQPFLVANSEYRLKCSVGLKYCATNQRGDEVLRDIDTALNRAKGNGRGRWVLFHQDFIKEITHRLIMEKELRKAIEAKQFEVYYQPIINISTRKIDGFEALIRWIHPEKGFISPVEFIPVAEETNLILPLGEYVLRTVVGQLKDWYDKGYSHLVGAVNTSVKQFQMTDISALIHTVLKESNLPNSALKIEVTESLAMNNVDYTISTFKNLDESGIKISIDDFGTGYSSLSYLKKFPFHTLKIDRSFVNEIQAKGDDAEITRAIVVMAKSLNLEIVAEGVETLEQLEFLEELGCDYYQGFYFSKPLPKIEFERLLERNFQVLKKPY